MHDVGKEATSTYGRKGVLKPYLCRSLSEWLSSPLARATMDSVEVRIAHTFGDVPVGQALLFVDSYGRLCIALNQGDLAEQIGIARSDRPGVRIRPKH